MGNRSDGYIPLDRQIEGVLFPVSVVESLSKQEGWSVELRVGISYGDSLPVDERVLYHKFSARTSISVLCLT